MENTTELKRKINRPKKGEIVPKYFDFLQDLYNDLQITPHIKATDYVKVHAVSQNTMAVLKRGGVIKSTPNKGRKRGYKWNTTPPTMRMANELVQRLRKVQKQKGKMSFDETPMDKYGPAKTPVIELAEMGILESKIKEEKTKAKKPKKTVDSPGYNAVYEKTVKFWFFKFTVIKKITVSQKTQKK